MKLKLIAFLMLAMLSVTALSATTASASPASAAPMSDPTQTVRVGENMVWVAPWYNVHVATSEGIIGTPKYTETSAGSKLATAVSVRSGQAVGLSSSTLGVKFSLKGITTPALWDAVKNRPVLVRALVSYKLSASGTSDSNGGSYVSLAVGSFCGGDPACPHLALQFDGASQSGGSGGSTAARVLASPHFTTTLEELGTGTAGQGLITMQLLTSADGQSGGSAQASGNIIVYAIELTWL